MAVSARDAQQRIRSLITEDDNGCWLFTGRVRKNGYARVTYKQESHYLHRLAYVAFRGPIPAGMDVCHRCDVRRCARPAHLFVGTRLDNMADAKRKGRLSSGLRHSVRVPHGERHPFAKLDWAKVRDIRRRHAAGERADALADQFDTDITNIRLIVRRRTWRAGPFAQIT